MLCIVTTRVNVASLDRFALCVFILSGWLITLCLHEFGHAITAYKGGDTSVEELGYLSLDITKYSLSFSLASCLLLMFGGFPLPSGAVSIRPSRLHSKRWMTLVSLAGPFVTLLCCLAMLAIVFGLWAATEVYPSIMDVYKGRFGQGCTVMAYFEMFAFILNLLPFPPLDGWHAVSPWLPASFFLKRWTEGDGQRSALFSTISLLGLLLVFFIFSSQLTSIIVRTLRLDASLLANGMSIFTHPF